MHVPTTAFDFDVAHATFDQSTRQQAALAEAIFAIFFAQLRGLAVEIEALQIFAFHQAQGAFIKVVVGNHAGVVDGFGEFSIDVAQHREAFLHHAGICLTDGMFQTFVWIHDRQWAHGGG